MITDEELARVPHLELLKRSTWNSLVRELQIRRQLQKFVYFEHTSACDFYQAPKTGACTCGLAALLSKLKELESV